MLPLPFRPRTTDDDDVDGDDDGEDYGDDGDDNDNNCDDDLDITQTTTHPSRKTTFLVTRR